PPQPCSSTTNGNGPAPFGRTIVAGSMPPPARTPPSSGVPAWKFCAFPARHGTEMASTTPSGTVICADAPGAQPISITATNADRPVPTARILARVRAPLRCHAAIPELVPHIAARGIDPRDSSMHEILPCVASQAMLARYEQRNDDLG